MTLQQSDKKNILHPFTIWSAEEFNIPIVKGSGEMLTDIDGKEYIDAISSWWVNLHGHSHPFINQRITDQLNKLEHVMFSGFTHEPAIQLAQKLLTLLPHYNQVFYSDNGSTAVEVALKMAFQYWKNKGQTKKRFLALSNGYHGDTFGSMSVSERDIFTKPFHEQLFTVDYIEIPDENNIDRTMEILEQLFQEENTAGFIFEPLIQGAGGMRMYRAEHLDFLLRLCKDYDVITIADEVMTGFGRTGKMFAVDHMMVKPDIICLSKGLTGGYLPMGATLYNQKISDVFASNDASKTFYHGHSFTANPISCTAALASLELFEQENTMDKITAIHEHHLNFADTIDQFDWVENVRVTGSVLALDIKTGYNDYFYNNPIKNTLKSFYLEQGVILRPLGNVVYVLPPYCISSQNLHRIFEVIVDSIKFLEQSNYGR